MGRLASEFMPLSGINAMDTLFRVVVASTQNGVLVLVPVVAVSQVASASSAMSSKTITSGVLVRHPYGQQTLIQEN